MDELAGCLSADEVRRRCQFDSLCQIADTPVDLEMGSSWCDHVWSRDAVCVRSLARDLPTYGPYERSHFEQSSTTLWQNRTNAPLPQEFPVVSSSRQVKLDGWITLGNARATCYIEPWHRCITIYSGHRAATDTSRTTCSSARWNRRCVNLWSSAGIGYGSSTFHAELMAWQRECEGQGSAKPCGLQNGFYCGRTRCCRLWSRNTPVRFAFSAAGAKCSICGLRIATILCPSIDSFHASKMTVPTTSHLSRLHPTQLPIRLMILHWTPILAIANNVAGAGYTVEARNIYTVLARCSYLATTLYRRESCEYVHWFI